MINCPICSNEATVNQVGPLNDYRKVQCNTCGNYNLTDRITPEMIEDKRENLYKVSSWIREQNDSFGDVPTITSDKFDEIVSMRDKKIQEKFELFISFLSKIPWGIEFEESDRYIQASKNTERDIDEEKVWHLDAILPKCWMKDFFELFIFAQKGINEGYINGEIIDSGWKFDYHSLTFDGLQYLESLDEPNKASKNIFVAFNFEESLNEVFNTFVKDAIKELGFNYVVVNQNNTEHDQAISDEIIAKLKSSRMIIADFTNQRNSVYFEAGFAMGMKIPIIWTCKEGHIDDLSFDTRQYPHIEWRDGEDLAEQIKNRIKVIL